MARKVTVALEDDLSGGPAERTVPFALNGVGYEIDLSSHNAAAFREQLAPFIAHARAAGRAPARTAATRQRSANIRAWAKEHGIAVSQRGRIPASVIQRYHTAAKARQGLASAWASVSDHAVNIVQYSHSQFC